MKSLPLICLLASLVPASGSIIIWNGASDGTNFNNPANWIGNAAPGAPDNAVITNGAGTTVVVNADTSVLSVQCSKAFSISNGTFSVSSGVSQITGAFAMASDTYLEASGRGTTFTASAAATADDANFVVLSGAIVDLPNLQNYNKSCDGANWTATGAGSTLELSGLTNFNGATCGNPTIEAEAGGQILATALTTMTAAYLDVYADGAGSLIDFGGLTNVINSSGYIDTFEASAGGVIRIPHVTGGPLISVQLNAGGSISTAQLTQLYALNLYAPSNCNALTNVSELLVSGATNSFASLSNFYDGNVTVEDGASVTFPVLQTYSKNCNGGNWLITGTNSVLNFPLLTNIIGNPCNYPVIQAESGGQLLLTNVISVAAGPLYFQADGNGSLIDLRKLSSCSGQSPYYVTFESSGGGTMNIPLMTGGPFVGVTLNAGASIQTSQITQLGFLVANEAGHNLNALTNLQNLTSAVTISFPALIDFTDGDATVSSGATVTFPALKNFAKYCDGANWYVSGAGSVLSFPALTNITGEACNYPYVQASGGGSILLASVSNILAGPLYFQSDGANSLIDLSGLSTVSGQSPYEVTFEAGSGGTILIPKVSGGPFTGVTLNPGGTLATSQIKKLYSLSLLGQGGNFNALTNLANLTTGVSINFPALIDFTDGNVLITNGATVTMPALTNYTKDCDGANWTVSGTNSVFDLPALTNITGQACTYPVIQAASGGQILLSNVLSILAGPLAFDADGAGSVINLNRLTNCSGQSPYQVTFEASAGGAIEATNFTGGPLVGITANPGGSLPLAQVQQLYSVTANNGAVANLPILTNLDGGSLSAQSGGEIELPALQSVQPYAGCQNLLWQASGSGSVINTPALSAVIGSDCSYDYIQAEAGGQLLLGNLSSLDGQYIQVLCDGSGSEIDLTNLTSFLSANAAAASLTAQNSGEILLGTQAFLLQNVNINIPPGNPLLPPVTSVGPGLNLYGIPGHSYLIEQLNTASPGATWQFFLRVPLTNALEQVAGAVSATTALRVTDFVADPPMLALQRFKPSDVQMILYGATNKTYEIQSALNLAAPVWTSNSVAAMTNAFRIFPPTAPSDSMEYFRAKQISP